MRDFSIIIAHRGNPMGLWMTIQTCELDLQGTDISREYIIVGNGEKETSDTFNHMKMLERAGLLAHYHHRDEPMSPPSARQYGSTYATGRYLCFLDNHCVPMPDFFRRAKADFEHYGMDILHGAHRYDIFQETHYHYRLKLRKNFWADETIQPGHEFLPYRVAMAGHGGFFVKTDVFREIGGYWNGFVGYGGEEPYFDLKAALLGKMNYLDPRIIHVHYVGRRGYPRHYTDDFCRNMMMAANIIGGEQWMLTVMQGLNKSTRVGSNPRNLYDLMLEAYDRSRERSDWLAARRQRTLDEQLEQFVVENVAH